MLLEMNVSLQKGQFNFAMTDAITGLFGESGAGKSTILGLIAGTLQPEKGHIVVDGKTVFDSRKGIMVPREQRPIAAVLQNDPSLTGQTIRSILSSGYERMPRPRRRLKPKRLIELLELGPILDRTIDQVSAGERQRVALARALLKSSRLLLLDEPFAPLSQPLRAQLNPLLKTVETELDLPALYASNSLVEILELTQRLVVVADGRIMSSGSLLDLAQGDHLATHLGSRPIQNLLTATIVSHDLVSGCTLAKTYGVELVLPPRPHLALGNQVHVSIGSNDIALSTSYLSGISMQNQIKGRICGLIRTGENILVQVDCGTTLLAGITPRACRDMALREGDSVYCLAKTQSFSYVHETDAVQEMSVLGHARKKQPSANL